MLMIPDGCVSTKLWVCEYHTRLCFPLVWCRPYISIYSRWVSDFLFWNEELRWMMQRGDVSLYLDKFTLLCSHLMLGHEWMCQLKGREGRSLFGVLSVTLPTYGLIWYFYTCLCVLVSARLVNSVQLVRWRRYIVNYPWGLLSALPLELSSLSTQHVRQAPWVATLPWLTQGG